MFQGSMVALVTPMLEDGSVDEDSLQRLVDFHVENQSDALVAVGTTGESATLDEEEHCYLIRRIVEICERVPEHPARTLHRLHEPRLLWRQPLLQDEQSFPGAGRSGRDSFWGEPHPLLQ